MPYINIDLDDIDTEELVDELINRIENKYFRDKIVGNAKLMKLIRELTGESHCGIPPKQSLEDVLKMEHISSVWNKYTSWQLQQLLPE